MFQTLKMIVYIGKFCVCHISMACECVRVYFLAQTLVLRRSDLVGEIFFTYMSGQTIKRKCTVLATTWYELGFAVAHALDWRRLNHGSCTMSYMLKLSFHLGSILTHAFETWWDFLSNRISILNQSIKRLTLKLDLRKMVSLFLQPIYLQSLDSFLAMWRC